MSCDRQQPCRPTLDEQIRGEGQEIAKLLDSRDPLAAAKYLSHDAYNMPAGQFNAVVREVMRNDRKNSGADLYIDTDGSLVIDTRNKTNDQLVVKQPHQFDRGGRIARVGDEPTYRPVPERQDPRYGQDPRYSDRQDPRQQGRNTAADAAVDMAFGALAGAAVNGRKGAVAGGLGAGAAKVIDSQLGDQSETVNGTAAKVLIPAAIGGLISGKDGAKAAGAGAAVQAATDWFRKREK